jgi:adenosylhomocysteine nucleosidase
MTLIVVAMEEEIQLFNNDHPNIQVLITGIGKVNAALKLSEYLTKHHVDIILNIGFSGLHGEGHLLDGMLLKQSEYHDVDATEFGYEFGQVPKMQKTYLSDQVLLDQVRKCLNIPLLNGYTGDQFVTKIPIYQGLYDMEATALFQTASYYQVPIVSIKIVSDIIGKQAYKDFNVLDGAKKINDIIIQLIQGGCL